MEEMKQVVLKDILSRLAADHWENLYENEVSSCHWGLEIHDTSVVIRLFGKMPTPYSSGQNQSLLTLSFYDAETVAQCKSELGAANARLLMANVEEENSKIKDAYQIWLKGLGK